LRLPVGDAHADGGEASLQGSLSSLAPGERAPFRLGEHVLSAEGEDIGQMPFARPAAWGDGEDEFDVAWVALDLPLLDSEAFAVIRLLLGRNPAVAAKAGP
jgi:hypothetical protein